MIRKDIIVSINVHEKPDYFLNQLNNINENLLLDKQVILSCNDYMFGHKDLFEEKGVRVNTEIINKKRYHGSILKGIISNMRLSLKEYDFEYFLIMSSREFFYRKLENFDQIKSCLFTDENDTIDNPYVPYRHSVIGLSKSKDYNLSDWAWPRIREKGLKLFSYLKENNMYISFCMHEGMCLSKSSCEYIINFFDNHKDIELDCFNFEDVMEEMVIQSLCQNYEGFYYIGNGVWEFSGPQLDPKKFTHKKRR